MIQYHLCRRWAYYLGNNTLSPINQLVILPSTLNPLSILGTRATADSQTLSNNTNLAIKGIIALQAMVEIGRILGKDDDVAMYSVCSQTCLSINTTLWIPTSFQNLSSNYLKTWMSLALSPNSNSPHILSSYGDPDTSWVLAYSLFADKLLPTSVIDDNVITLYLCLLHLSQSLYAVDDRFSNFKRYITRISSPRTVGSFLQIAFTGHGWNTV